MPLVFVHGVSVRESQDYEQSEKVRDGLFRNIALTGIADNPGQVVIENPYWGQYAAALAFKNASLPDGQYLDFGGETVFEQILTETASDIQAPSQDQVLLTLAKNNLSRAVDTLWAAAAFTDSGRPPGMRWPPVAVQAPRLRREESASCLARCGIGRR